MASCGLEAWPELKGCYVDDAVDAIKKARPDLSVFKVPRGSFVTADLCFVRVRVYYGSDGKVSSTPSIG